MMNTENAYFEGMRKIAEGWQDAKEEREAMKKEIIDTYGWDSEELKAWYAEDKAAKFPFSSGAMKAYRAWAASVRNQIDTMEMQDFLFDNEVEAFVIIMRNAGIKSFVYTNRSTAVMDNIIGFVSEGCKIVGPGEVVRKSRWNGEEKVTGIRFELN